MTIRPTRRGLAAITFIAATVLSTATVSNAGGGDAPPPQPSDERTVARVAPVVGANRTKAIRDRYIVVMDKDTPAASRSLARNEAQRLGAKVHFEYSAAIKGFAATLPKQALDGLRRNPNVLLIEADRRVRLEATQSPATWASIASTSATFR